MRVTIPVLGLLLLSWAHRAWAKAPRTRGTTRGATRARPSKAPNRTGHPLIDDPDMEFALEELMEARITPPKKPWQGPSRQGPTFLLAYRYAKFDCVVSDCAYHQFDLVVYPIAATEPEIKWLRLLRFGVGIEAGGENTSKREKWWQHAQIAAGYLSLGLQYPWRLTPFVDFVSTVGALHRNVYNKDTFLLAFSVGLEAGLSLFLFGSLHVTISLGWRRFVADTEPERTYYDSFTVAAGFGV